MYIIPKDRAHAAAIDREYEAEALARTLALALEEIGGEAAFKWSAPEAGLLRIRELVAQAKADPAAQAFLKD